MVFLSKVASFIIISSIYAWIILWLNTIIMKLCIMFFGLCHPTLVLAPFYPFATLWQEFFAFLWLILPGEIFLLSFKAFLILMAFSYLKSVAYIRDGILIKKL